MVGSVLSRTPAAIRDAAIERTARRQHGVIARAQALEAGFTSRTIDHRIDSGRWIRLDSSVYALASHPFTWHRQLMAAVLSVEASVASGRSAAVLHGFPGFRPGRPEITIAPGRSERSRLAIVHRSAFVQQVEVSHIPCTTVAHTVLGVAARLGTARLEGLVDDLIAARAVSTDELIDQFIPFAAGRRPGTRALRAILTARTPNAYEPPASVLERLLHDLLDDPTLPRFDRQFELPWWPPGQGRVDAYCAPCSLIVEADGRRWHTRERDFVSDRRRDNLATANGHVVLRFSHVDLTRDARESRRIILDTIRSRMLIAGPAAPHGQLSASATVA